MLDGEVVAFDGAQTSFSRLQQRGERPAPVFFYVFDILHLGGEDVTAEPLRERKALLRNALAFDGPDPLHDRTATATARRSTRRPAARAGRA